MSHPDVQLPGRFTPQQAADLAEIQQRIFFYGWCIDHRRFDDLDGLVAQLHRDVADTRAALG